MGKILIPIKEILEVTRWKQEARNLSKDSIKKIERSGIRKSDSVLADGMNVGTSNILDKQLNRPEVKMGMNLSSFVDLGGGGYDNETNKIHLPKKLTMPMKLISSTDSIFQNNGQSKLSNAITKRHEAYEAKSFNELKNRELRNGTFAGNNKVDDKGNFFKERRPLAKKISGQDYFKIGNHWSGKVLTREANDLNKMAYTRPAQRFIKMRTDENNILKKSTGIDLNNIDNKNLSKVNKKIDKYEATNDKYY